MEAPLTALTRHFQDDLTVDTRYTIHRAAQALLYTFVYLPRATLR